MHLLPRTVAVVAVAGKGGCAGVGEGVAGAWLVGCVGGGYSLAVVRGVKGRRVGGGVGSERIA